MVSENSNDDKEKETSSDITQEVSEKEGFIARHSKAIVALTAIGSLFTTVVLAFLAYLSWSEVHKQRDLAVKTLILSHAPSVRVYVTNRFEFSKEIGWMYWQVVNKGGPVYDVEYKSVLLCCGSDLIDSNRTKIVIRTSKGDRLTKDEGNNISIEVKDAKTLEWLKQAVNSSDTGLYLYVRAKYTIPKALSLSGEPEEDETFRISIWDPGVGRFENVRPETQALILRLIKKREYLTVEKHG